MNKFRLLRADEIECRISSIGEKGLTLLLYKTARTDANLLDETVGGENWQNDFKMVDGVLYGGIGIHEPQDVIDQWVWKWDAGTESNTEAEKGRASDAFKRAGFKWGIGRELYTSPFIWIPSSSYEIKKNERGKLVCYDDFRVVEIEYNDKSEISKLIIANDTRGVDVFSYPKFAQKGAKAESKPKEVKVSTENDKSAGRPQIAPREAPDGYYYCENCGNVITQFKSKGTVMSSKDFAVNALARYGKQLCKECASKMKNEGKAS